MIITSIYNTPYGELILGSYEDKLCLCDWKFRKQREAIDKRLQKGLNASFEEGNSEVLELTKQQLKAYLAKECYFFDIPILLIGTQFQKEVWKALRNIPYGNTISYLELAYKLNNPKAIRAIASANGANAISIIIPCHRIIGSDGNMVGYAGGLKAKKNLLKLENGILDNQMSLF